MLLIWSGPKFVIGKELTLPKRQILDSSKQKELADGNFRFDKNGRKFLKSVEKTVGKGEITCNEQFLLFPQCFKTLVLQAGKNKGLFGKGITLGFIFTNHSQERSRSYSPRLSKYESNKTFDWPKQMVGPIKSCISF